MSEMKEVGVFNPVHNADRLDDSTLRAIGVELFPHPIGVIWTVNTDHVQEDGSTCEAKVCKHPHRTFASVLECMSRHSDFYISPVYFRGVVKPHSFTGVWKVQDFREQLDACVDGVVSSRRSNRSLRSILKHNNYPEWLADGQ